MIIKRVGSLTHSWSWALLEKLPIVQSLKFPAFYGTRRFITVFTRTLYWSLSWARSILSIPSHPISLRSILLLSTHPRLGGPRLLVVFRNKLIFYGEELLAPRPTPKLEDQPLSAIRDCLFNIFSSIRNQRTRHDVVTRDPPNMESRLYNNIKIDHN
jgi:hypothetical protein